MFEWEELKKILNHNGKDRLAKYYGQSLVTPKILLLLPFKMIFTLSIFSMFHNVFYIEFYSLLTWKFTILPQNIYNFPLNLSYFIHFFHTHTAFIHISFNSSIFYYVRPLFQFSHSLPLLSYGVIYLCK